MAGPIRIAVLANAMKAKAEIDSVGTRSQKMGKAVKVAGRVAAAGLLVVGAAAVKAGQAAAADEAAQSRLAQTLHTAAKATKAQQAQTERYVTAAGKAYGVTDDSLRPSLAKLAAATHDVKKAQSLANVAMNVAAARGLSLESVSQALAKAQGGSVAGLAKLGIKVKSTTKDTAALLAANIGARKAQVDYNAALKKFGPNAEATKAAAAKLALAQVKVGEAQKKTKSTTLTADQAVKRLANTYKGAAAKAADTTAGKQKRLQVQFGELQEQIGAGLLPIMAKAATAGLKTVEWISNNTGKAKALGIAVGVVAGTILAANVALKAYTLAAGIYNAVTTLQAANAKRAAAGQLALNAALFANPIGLVVLGVTALVAGLVVAYKKSDKFRAVVNGAFNAVRTFVPKAVSATIGFVKKKWPLLLGILAGPVGLAVVLIVRHWSTIRSATSKAWGAISGAVTGAASKVVSAVRGLKSKVTGALGASKTYLVETGKNVVRGLISGIGSIAGDVTKALLNLLPKPLRKFAGKLGIKSPSRLFMRFGRFIVAGLTKGIDGRREALSKSLTGLAAVAAKGGEKLVAAAEKRVLKGASKIAKKYRAEWTKNALKAISAESRAVLANARAQEKNAAALKTARAALKALRQEAASYAKGIKDAAVKGGDITSVLSGSSPLTGKGAVASMAANLKDRLAKVKRFSGLVKALIKKGLNKTSLQQILDAGIDGGGLDTAAALSEGGKKAVKQINSLQGSLNKAAGSLGSVAADKMYGAGLTAAEGLVKGLEKRQKDLEKVGRRLARALIAEVRRVLNADLPKNITVGGSKGSKRISIGTTTSRRTAAAAFATTVDPNNGRARTITLRLTAAQISQLQRGREIRADLDAYEDAGGRRTP